jgi:hypothetical protein
MRFHVSHFAQDLFLRDSFSFFFYIYNTFMYRVLPTTFLRACPQTPGIFRFGFQMLIFKGGGYTVLFGQHSLPTL